MTSRAAILSLGCCRERAIAAVRRDPKSGQVQVSYPLTNFLRQNKPSGRLAVTVLNLSQKLAPSRSIRRRSEEGRARWRPHSRQLGSRARRSALSSRSRFLREHGVDGVGILSERAGPRPRRQRSSLDRTDGSSRARRRARVRVPLGRCASRSAQLARGAGKRLFTLGPRWHALVALFERLECTRGRITRRPMSGRKLRYQLRTIGGAGCIGPTR